MNHRSERAGGARCAIFWLALMTSVAVHGQQKAASGAASSTAGSAASAPGPQARIRATIVVTGGGKPLEQAEVTFDYDKKKPKTLFTGKNGEASVVFDAKRKVNIRVIAKGDWETKLADEVELANGARVEIELKARARP